MPIKVFVEDTEAKQQIRAIVHPDEAKVEEITFRSENGGLTNTHALARVDFPGLVKSLGLDVIEPVETFRTEPIITDPPAPAKKTTAKKAATKKAAAKKAASAKPAETATSPAQRRPYRRYPDDFAEAVRELGESATDLMKRFDAPEHTIKGWLRRYRGAATPADAG